MKSLVISALICISSTALAEDALLRVVQHGTETTLTDGKAVSSLIALVESASFDSTDDVNPAKRWDTDLRTPAHLHAHFQPKRQIQVRSTITAQPTLCQSAMSSSYLPRTDGWTTSCSRQATATDRSPSTNLVR